jgi:hypothetical protein
VRKRDISFRPSSNMSNAISQCFSSAIMPTDKQLMHACKLINVTYLPVHCIFLALRIKPIVRVPENMLLERVKSAVIRCLISMTLRSSNPYKYVLLLLTCVICI